MQKNESFSAFEHLISASKNVSCPTWLGIKLCSKWLYDLIDSKMLCLSCSPRGEYMVSKKKKPIMLY